jgi:hypothetical protein
MPKRLYLCFLATVPDDFDIAFFFKNAQEVADAGIEKLRFDLDIAGPYGRVGLIPQINDRT